MHPDDAKKEKEKAAEDMEGFVRDIVEKLIKGEAPGMPKLKLTKDEDGSIVPVFGGIQPESGMEIGMDEGFKVASLVSTWHGINHLANNSTAQLLAILNAIGTAHTVSENTAQVVNKDHLQATRHADIAIFHHWPTWALALVEIFGDEEQKKAASATRKARK